MFCSKCGKEINDEAVVCIHCGCAVNGAKKPAASEDWKEVKISKGMQLLCTFVPIVGFILGFAELCSDSNSAKGKSYLILGACGLVTCGIIIGAACLAVYLA